MFYSGELKMNIPTENTTSITLIPYSLPNQQFAFRFVRLIDNFDVWENISYTLYLNFNTQNINICSHIVNEIVNCTVQEPFAAFNVIKHREVSTQNMLVDVTSTQSDASHNYKNIHPLSHRGVGVGCHHKTWSDKSTPLVTRAPRYIYRRESISWWPLPQSFLPPFVRGTRLRDWFCHPPPPHYNPPLSHGMASS